MRSALPVPVLFLGAAALPICILARPPEIDEARRDLGGLSDRADLAEALSLQPWMVGPMFGAAIHGGVLEDVRLAVEEPTSGEAVLRGLESVLRTPLAEVPDPATVVAREHLWALEWWPKLLEDSPRDLAAPSEAAELAMVAGLARVHVELAAGCRESGCRAAVGDIRERVAGTPLALGAVALRLEAEELGVYPERLENLPPMFALARGDVPGVLYRRASDGSAVLVVEPDRAGPSPESDTGESGRRSTWTLPAPRRGEGTSED